MAEIWGNQYAKLSFLKHLRDSIPTVHMLARWIAMGSIVLFWPHALPAQHDPPSADEVQEFAWLARAEASVWKAVPVPDEIVHELKEKDSENSLCNIETPDDLETHQIVSRSDSVVGLPVQGHGRCLCSPAGNCDFWIFQSTKGKYRLVLESNVQVFGFLKSRTKGLPDLVTWSHASAFDSEGRLFRFSGKEYMFAATGKRNPSVPVNTAKW